MKHTLEVRNLLCPMPVIKTQSKVKECANQDTLVVIATDPGVKQDIPSWCRIHGHQVLSIEEQADDIVITIKVIK